MKIFSRIITALFISGLLFTACEKKDTALPTASSANAPILAAKTTSLLLNEADSSNKVDSFYWSDPMYSIADPSKTIYTLEFDTTLTFGKSTKISLTGTRNKLFLGKDLNQLLLDLGLTYNVQGTVYTRVISSQPNNNERKVSNTLTLTVRAYKTSPKVALPVGEKLFIVGGATPGGWANPVPTPTQEFSRIEEYKYAAIIDFAGGGSYLLLHQNGSWNDKFGGTGANNNSNNTAGDGFKNAGSDLAAPTAAGKYLLIFDFFRGTFTCTPYTGPTLPTDLFIVGGATPGGWNNPVPTPTQQFTRLNNCEFQISSLALTVDKYLLLKNNGSWNDKYGGVGASNGSNNPMEDMFKEGGSDLAAPTVAGNYKMNFNFATAKYKLTKL